MRTLAGWIIVLCCANSVAVGFAAETAGIGIAITNQEDGIAVHRILPDSPATANKSIRVGDRILAVAQAEQPAVDVEDMAIEEVVPLIRGPAGTEVRLTLLSPGKDIAAAHTVSLTRGELPELARWGDGVPLAAGTKAPNIELKRLADGSTAHLADYAGKVVVLEFWSTWCGPCQARMIEFQTYVETHQEWKDKVAIVAASVDDDAETAAKHVESAHWTRIDNVWVGDEALKAFHVGSLPTTYILDRRGVVVAAEPDEAVSAIVERLLNQ
jgi:peroxiredoxin